MGVLDMAVFHAHVLCTYAQMKAAAGTLGSSAASICAASDASVLLLGSAASGLVEQLCCG
jgi:hypothetical protein